MMTEIPRNIRLEQREKESEAPLSIPIMHLIMLHMHPCWIRYSEGMPSFIVYLPVGDMMPNNLLDVSSNGWCNSYQRLDDARALR